MKYTEIKSAAVEHKRLHANAKLPEIYCYLAIRALYDDYNNNKRDVREIISMLREIEQNFNRSVEQYEAYNKAMVHIGDYVKAKLADGTIISGKIHTIEFYSPTDYSVNIIADNRCVTSVGADMIIYKEAE